MTGSEALIDQHSLVVYLASKPIADITLAEDALHWRYREDWDVSGYAISPHLPLNSEIPPINTQRFLRNLLPEGEGFDELVQSFRISKNNTFGLIRQLGADTPGSLVILPNEQLLFDDAKFRPLEETELAQRLDQREAFGLVLWDNKPRLSVAGVQDKLNVIVLPDGSIGFGDGSLCSTHILKFEKQKYVHLVLNEYVTMELARACDLDVAEVELLRFGDHPALLVKRFDRRMSDPTTVQRRHMIDGCQALNLSPDSKYERNFGSGRDVQHIRDGASLPKLFKFIQQCNNPALARQTLLDWVLFNLLVFNNDAHGKNISFFVGAKGLEITPFYDLVNIAMYPEFEQELAMALGDEFDSNTINAYQLADFAEECELVRSLVISRTRRMAKAVLSRISTVLENISTSTSPLSEQEQEYLGRYHMMINTRAHHLLEQAEDVAQIEL